jgi:hypothetical protein
LRANLDDETFIAQAAQDVVCACQGTGVTGEKSLDDKEGAKAMSRHFARAAGFALNALLRASLAAFLIDVFRHPQDPRYAGKAIPVRNLLVVGTLSGVLPFLHVVSRLRNRPKWTHYPLDFIQMVGVDRQDTLGITSSKEVTHADPAC